MKKLLLSIFVFAMFFTQLSSLAYAETFVPIVDNIDALTAEDEEYFETIIWEIASEYDYYVTIVSTEFGATDTFADFFASYSQYDATQDGAVFAIAKMGDDFDFAIVGYGEYSDTISGDTISSFMSTANYARTESEHDKVFFDMYEGALSTISAFLRKQHAPAVIGPEDYIGIGDTIDGFDPMLDAAEIFTEDEEAKLFARIEEIHNEYDFDITLMTLNSVPDGYQLLFYIDWFRGLDPTRDGAVFAIDIDPENRDYATSTRNSGQESFTEDALDLIDSEIAPLLTDGDYYSAYNLFLDHTVVFLEASRSGEPFNVPMSTTTFLIFVVIVPFAIAQTLSKLTVKLTFVRAMKSAVIQTKARDFVRPNSLQLTTKSDVFSHQTQIQTKIERSKSSSRSGYGGSRGGRSGKF